MAATTYHYFCPDCVAFFTFTEGAAPLNACPDCARALCWPEKKVGAPLGFERHRCPKCRQTVEVTPIHDLKLEIRCRKCDLMMEREA